MESSGRSRLGALLLLLLLSWESAAFVFHEPLEEEMSQILTLHAAISKEHEVNRKGKYCKHFGLCFFPL